MKEAGLTHGGFYGHFDSKDDLVAKACTHALVNADDSWRSAADPQAALAAAYLNPEHCANPGGGCVLAALGPDIARQPADARKALTDSVRTRVDQLATLLPGRSASARRKQAIATWAGLVGAMVLARGVDDPSLTEEILEVGKKVFGGKAPAAR
jgi:TetR/AcrR family transcriptional repressor of nem operon